jgi:hypothetical protein
MGTTAITTTPDEHRADARDRRRHPANVRPHSDATRRRDRGDNKHQRDEEPGQPPGIQDRGDHQRNRREPRDRPHRRHDHRPAGAELAQPDDRRAEHGQDGEHRDQDRAELD